MKRLLPIAVLVIGFCGPGFAAPPGRGRSSGPKTLPEPEVVGLVQVADVKPGMRVRIRLTRGKPLTGTVTRVTDSVIQVDLSAEATGLPGKFRFRKSEVAEVLEVKPQTDEEKELIVEQRKQKISRIKVEVAERREKQKAAREKEGADEQTAREDLRKALDVVVAAEDEARMRALLEEFPPEEWGEDKFREIRETWILRDLAPNEKESRFVTLFREWQRARDTIAVLDARKQAEDGERLLLTFPPSEGWGLARLEKILQKEVNGETLSEEEVEFRNSWEAWSQALIRRAAEQRPEAAPGEEQPVQEKQPAGEKVPAAKEKERPVEGPPAEEKPTE